MAIYEYKCADGHETTINGSMKDYEPKVKCSAPKCRKIARRNYQDQNVLGTVEGGTRGGRHLLLNNLKKKGIINES
jgi:hypothetical protein